MKLHGESIQVASNGLLLFIACVSPRVYAKLRRSSDPSVATPYLSLFLLPLQVHAQRSRYCYTLTRFSAFSTLNYSESTDRKF
ncbi:hypothetical protein F5888DRAFT_1678878, partial [Russula emetica]